MARIRLVQFIIASILLFLLTACADGGNSADLAPYMPEYAAPAQGSPQPELRLTDVAIAKNRMTIAAQEAQVAQVTVQAEFARGTAEAAVMTRAVEDQERAVAATATQKAADHQAAAMATADMLELTKQALIIRETVQSLDAQGTIQAAAAAGTAAAVAQITTIEAQAAVDRDRQRQLILRQQEAEAERAENWAGFLSYAQPVMLAAVIIALAVFLRIYWQANSIRILPPNQALIMPTRNGPHLVPATAAQYTLPPASPRLISVSSPGSTYQSQDGTRQNGLPAPLLLGRGSDDMATGRIDLPERLLPGKIGLGATPGGQAWYDHNTLGDLLVAGIKGGGKSNLANLLAYQAQRQGWSLFLADPEQLSFDPALWGHVAASKEDVLSLFEIMHREFERRFDLYREASYHTRQMPGDQAFLVRDIDQYNRAAEMLNMEKLPPMLFVWDEANSFIGDRDIDKAVFDLLRANRKPGCRVAIMGHRWHVKQVDGAIRDALTRRIAFQCSKETSNVVLDNNAASQITNAEKGMAYTRDGRRFGVFKTFFLPDIRLIRDVHPITIPGEIVRPAGGNHSAQTNGHHLDATSNTMSMSAMVDAEKLRQADPRVWASRRQVAIHLADYDNGDGYAVADDALAVLADGGDARAVGLLRPVYGDRGNRYYEFIQSKKGVEA